MYVAELDRIVLKDACGQRPFASTQTNRKAVITTRVLGLVHELCRKRIHVTKRDLFYTDVKLFQARAMSRLCAVQWVHSCLVRLTVASPLPWRITRSNLSQHTRPAGQPAQALFP